MGFTLDGKTLAESRFPRGSEWRRWDLHIHTPESVLGTSYPGINWDIFVGELKKEAEAASVAVIGVTDYLSIDGYVKLLEEQKDGKFSHEILLIPNIEFRAQPSTSDGKALNIHLLIDPSQPDHIERIIRALSDLKFEYNREKYGCIKNELIRFGKVLNSSLADAEAYKFAISQFKPDYERILEWIAESAWLQENCLLGVSNGKDGISGLPTNGFSAVRDKILRQCSFVFSGNPNDRDYYLGQKQGVPKSEILRLYGGLKPCIHGSDAHKTSDLFKPNLDRYCWIKADISFNGLRQIVWEPKDRVFIGKTPPSLPDRSQIIKKVIFTNTRGWFNSSSLELNQSLVTIIGEKGSGKTALAELIAFNGGARYAEDSQSSFIVKGKNYLEGLGIQLEWGTGEVTSCTLLNGITEYARPRVRYLSQDFVERLCSLDIGGSELQLAIEEVLFSKLNEVQKEDCSSFAELRQNYLSSSQIRRQGIHGELAGLNREIERLTLLVDQKQEKQKQKTQVEAEVEELKRQLPEASTDIDPTILAELEKNQGVLKRLEDLVGQKNKQRRKIDDAIQSYQELIRETSASIGKIKNVLLESGVPIPTADLIEPKWNKEAAQLVRDVSIKISKEIDTLTGSCDSQSDAQTIPLIKQRLQEINGHLMKDDVAKKRLLELQKSITDKITTIERLSKELKQIQEKYLVERDIGQKRQIKLYIDAYDTITADETALHSLYSPLEESMRMNNSDLKFSVKVGYRINQARWIDTLRSFLDNRKKGIECKIEAIINKIESEMIPSLDSGNSEYVKKAIEHLVQEIEPIEFVKSYMLQKATLSMLYDWLFSLDHVELVYKIEYANTDLEFLSPGTRGIALLVLYLMMDIDDMRPLIIDQPEGNLDSSSIFKQLVPYITDAKRRRQVILITHNPNLVVATDAEQVVIASMERVDGQIYPKISYASGSLEHTIKSENAIGIKEAVCTVLEGGADAFTTRETQYNIR